MLNVKTLMLAILLSLVLASWVNGQEPKERMYIWDFIDNNGQQSELTARITSEFEEALIQAKCFQVLERRQFDKLLAHIKNEKAIADITDISQKSQSEIRKITNAQIVAFGKVDDDVDSGQIKITVSFQHFDSSKQVESIRIQRGLKFDAESREKAMRELVKKICPNNDTTESRFRIISPQQEVGTYRAYRVNEPPMDATITFENGKLYSNGAGQRYLLEHIAGRRYKLVVPGLDGYFVTFRPVNGDESKTEMFLEQPPPMSNFVLPKIK